MNFTLSRKLYYVIKAFIWLCYLVFLSNTILTSNVKEIIVSVMLCGILVQWTIISFVDNWYRYKRPRLLDWFRLTTFYVIIFNFFTFIKTFENQDNFRSYILKAPDILDSIWVLLVGLFALKVSEWIYIYFTIQRKKSKKFIAIYTFRSINLFLLSSIFISLVQLFLLIKGEVGYGTFQENTTSDLSFVFKTVALLANLFLSLFAIFKFIYHYQYRNFNLCFLIIFCIQILFGFLSGMKESLIVPLLIVLIPFIFSGGILKKRYVTLGVVLLLLLYPLNDNYRTVLNETKLSKVDAFALALNTTFSLEFTTNLKEGSENFSDRLSLYPIFVYAIDKEPLWNYYKHMDRYLYLPVAWIIPRAFLPDKPKSDSGAILNQQISNTDTNSLTPTTYGWAYLEGGALYVFMAFLLFGLVISYIQFNLKTHTIYGLLLYIGLIILLLKVESDIYFIISSILQMALIYFIFFKLFIKEKLHGRSTNF